MNGKKIVLTLLIFSVLTVSSVSAQTSVELKLGFVNIGRLLQESPQAKIATAALEDEFAPRQREILSLQTAFDNKQARLQKDAEVMGAEERENAARELQNDQRDLRRLQVEFREDVDIRRNEALGKVQQEVFIVITEFGKSAGYDIIFAEGIAFASERVDVTQQVLDRLQAKQ